MVSAEQSGEAAARPATANGSVKCEAGLVRPAAGGEDTGNFFATFSNTQVK